MLLEVMTFVSAIHQNPLLPNRLLGGELLRSKGDHIVRIGIEKLIMRQHLRDTWPRLADNFSALLEELQRAHSMGMYGRTPYQTWY